MLFKLKNQNLTIGLQSGGAERGWKSDSDRL